MWFKKNSGGCKTKAGDEVIGCLVMLFVAF
jgi:hypothetical protein